MALACNSPKALLFAATTHIFLWMSFVALAQDCDCSSFTGTCTASVKLENQRLEFRTNTNQCAFISFSINGDPGSITIKGGSGETDYLRTSRKVPALDVDGCSICNQRAVTRRANEAQIAFDRCMNQWKQLQEHAITVLKSGVRCYSCVEAMEAKGAECKQMFSELPN